MIQIFINYQIFVVYSKFIYFCICSYQPGLLLQMASMVGFPHASPALTNISCLLLLLLSKPQQIEYQKQLDPFPSLSSTMSVVRQHFLRTNIFRHNGMQYQPYGICLLSSWGNQPFFGLWQLQSHQDILDCHCTVDPKFDIKSGRLLWFMERF